RAEPGAAVPVERAEGAVRPEGLLCRPECAYHCGVAAPPLDPGDLSAPPPLDPGERRSDT
ncbi:MFS transporter, partial [Streptomyces sp. 4503]|nr:MFS transporter [Streptomyces niphimycinicus]